MKLRQLSLSFALLLIVAGLAGCGTATVPAATPVPAAYTDPFAYCAAVGTIDAPDAAYTGSQVPQSVAEGLQKALNTPDLPLDLLLTGSSWRCMDGQVYACFVGANLPCEAKANTDRTPTQEEIDFCQLNPDSDFIPAAVTGRETVFEWRCRDGAPEIVRQVFQPDAQGFLSEIWYRIGATGAEGTMPNPASEFCEEQGYRLEIRDEAGGQVGYCLFPDGSECEEWAFYRGECAPPTEGQGTPPQLANPASENCVAVGGTVLIESRADGGQYGICLFEDNRQCEEWALLRGDCPVGGVKITGYSTPAAVYCAISGGEYAITGNSGADDEQGTCTLKDGSQCDAWGFYNGECASPTPAAPAGSEQIVFDSTRSGYRDLYVMNSDGHDLSRLTQGEADSIAGPWSPDGTRIVYTTFGLTASDIVVINADGSGQVNLTNTPDIDEGFPCWSPDGNHIAFTSRRDGNNEIYVMEADGENASRWTDNPADDLAPAWSPDGTMIAFVSDRDREAGIYDLYIMSVVSTAVTRLTDDAAIDYSPAWSPDGTRIAFRSHHDGPADIYVINVDGTGLTNLTNDPADDWAPTWSPDGGRIAFQTNRDGNWEVYVMNADGTGPVNLTQDPADDQMPYWRP